MEIMGMILSIAGMLVTVCSFQVKSKRGLLVWQTVGTGFYLVSYIFSGGGIAVWLNVIYLVRNFLFMRFDGQTGKKGYITAALLCVSYLLAYICYICFANITTADKLWNVLPVLGAFFGTAAVANSDVNRLRAWKTGDSLSWLAFNIHIGLGALGGILGEIFNLASIAVGIYRFKRGRTEKQEKKEVKNSEEK